MWKKVSKKETYNILYYVFDAIGGVLLIIWVFYLIFDIMSIGFDIISDNPMLLLSWFLHPLFIIAIIFAIIGSVFKSLRKDIEKEEKETLKVIVPQQQQQQLVVNIPQPYIPQPEQERVVKQSTGRTGEKVYEEEPIDGVYCIQCGSKNVKIAKFCRVCGATIE